ncbi:MAG: hypothetical protein Aurels2KO_52860 [Aureliella sp.]
MRPLLPTIAVFVLTFACTVARAMDVTIPGSTAYLEEAQDAASSKAISQTVQPIVGRSRVRVTKNGVVGFGAPGVVVAWYGRFANSGDLNATLQLASPADAATTLTLNCDSQSKQCSIEAGATTAEFSGLQIKTLGSHALRLSSDSNNRLSIESLTLTGAATDECHFNLKPRRNAASVHLRYPQSDRKEVAAFYCEMTASDDPIWSYYMACGWHRGYFGMQVNSETERRIIFSVWDSGNEAIDRDKVGQADRVQLVAKGEGVYSGDFGNEGTGGHSHLKFNWKTGERQKFVVTAKPVDATHTVYSGYYFRKDLDRWMLISSWKAPKEGGYMRGLYSFSENFVGHNGQVRRKALYGNQWIKTADQKWSELTKASFSHDVTGRADRFDRFMGVEQGEFFLSHGFATPEGLSNGFTEYGKSFDRPALKRPPAIKLPDHP